MSNLTILRTYALKNPAGLPPSILFSHSARTVTIYDAYPKSIFHFLVLPRVISPQAQAQASSSKSFDENEENVDVKSDLEVTSQSTTDAPPSVTDLSSLHTLLNSKDVSKEQTKEVILSMKEDALAVKAEIEQEMEKRYGFVWDVWVGFHSAPSMEHMHLHVLSADLCSERVKVRKHYNSFHPKLGFFLHVDDVLSWFDAEPSYYQNMARLPQSHYKALLKEPLVCFHCKTEQKNMPTLKAHLQTEWEKLKMRAGGHKKRKLESDEAHCPSPSDLAGESDVTLAHKKSKRDKS